MTRYIAAVMKLAVLVVCFLVFIPPAALACGDDFDIVQLNTYGGNAQPPLDQPHGVSISDEGTINTFGPDSVQRKIGKTTGTQRRALLTDVVAIYPGALVDQDAGQPTCSEPTVDYNITKYQGGDTITLIHYFQCHTYIAVGGLPPDQATYVMKAALRIKTTLDGIMAYSQFGQN